MNLIELHEMQLDISPRTYPFKRASWDHWYTNIAEAEVKADGPPLYMTIVSEPVKCGKAKCHCLDESMVNLRVFDFLAYDWQILEEPRLKVIRGGSRDE